MATGRRLDHIDGLRGAAALAVVLQHALQMVHEAGHANFHPILSQVNLGRFGVVLFFLISGCVIPFSFKGERPLRNFAVSRFFRLYPAYWLSIPILALVALSRGEPVSPGMVLGNLTMIQGFWGGSHIGAGYWTLGYEMAFYMLCALLFWRGWLRDARLVTTLGAAILAASLWSGEMGDPANYTQAPYFFALFLLGTVLRLALVDGEAAARGCALFLSALTALAGAELAWRASVGDPYFTRLALGTAMVLPIGLFVLVLRWRPAMPRLAVWLGAISYSVYLFQDVGLFCLRGVVSPQAHPLLYIALVLGLTIALAALVHRWVEQPMIAMGRRFTRAASKPEPALAAG